MIAIAGRPNVGKSTLFNVLVGERISIEEPTPGVTRDRVAARRAHDGRVFEIVDTGGIGIEDSQNLDDLVQAQIEIALSQADVILFVVDVRDGVTPLDLEVAGILRKRQVPLLLVANKVDAPKFEAHVVEFHRLGLGDPIAISARERFGVRDLLSSAVALLPPPASVEGEEGPIEMKIAVVGKPNAGKSSIINVMVGDERVIVSEVPGTTRDAIDIHFERNGRHYIAIDTAGIRRKKSVEGSIDFYSQARAERSIRRADVVLFVIDSTTPVSIVDKKIAAYIRDYQKPCVLVVNKWDLAKEKHLDPEAYRTYLDDALAGMAFAPISMTIATTGKNVPRTLDLAGELFAQAGRQIGTGELNRVVQLALDRHPPRTRKRSQPKVYYATQVGVHPPSIVLFCNDPKSFAPDYRRYLENVLRESFEMEEVPIRMIFKTRPRTESPALA